VHFDAVNDVLGRSHQGRIVEDSENTNGVWMDVSNTLVVGTLAFLRREF